MELVDRLKLTFGLQPSFFRGMDVSHYEPYIEWEKVRDGGIGYSFMKASQGVVSDPVFTRLWQEAKGIMPRGAYHFYDSVYSQGSPHEQLDRFLQQLGPDLGELPLVLDIEGIYATMGTHPGWQNWLLFLNLLRDQVWPHEIMIYTSPYFWRDNVPADALPNFAEYPLWIANYGVTAPRIPAPWGNFDQSDDWTFWQYSDEEYIDGIFNENGQPTQVDVNYFNGSKTDFYVRFDLDIIDPGIDDDIVDYWFKDKVKHTYFYRENPRPYYAHKVEFAFSDLEKVNTNGLHFLGTAKYYHDSRGEMFGRPPDIVINGDHGSPGLPYGFVVTDGDRQKIVTTEDCLQWGENQEILGVAYELMPGVYNCVGCSDILLQNGAPPPPPDTTDDVSVDPRTCIFWNDTGYILLSVEGRNNGTLGLTRKECSDLGLGLGAMWGVNLDGGDSCSLVFDDNGEAVVINNPPEGVLKSVVQHVGWWIKRTGEDPIDPPTGDGMYEYTLPFDVGERSYTQADPGHEAPSMYSTKIAQVKAGTYQTDRPIFQSDGMDWVDFGNGHGAIPLSWQGVTYVTNFHEVGVEPPPTGPAFSFKVEGFEEVSGNLEPE